MKAVTKSITAQNTFTDWITPSLKNGQLNVSISGVDDSEVTLQRSFDGGSTALDYDSYITNTEFIMYDAEVNVLYRLGVKTGDYGTDTVAVRLSR